MEFEGLISNRCSMYGFLARIYRVEIDQEFLDRMNIPTKSDLQALSAKIAALSEKVDELNKTQRS